MKANYIKVCAMVGLKTTISRAFRGKQNIRIIEQLQLKMHATQDYTAFYEKVPRE